MLSLISFIQYHAFHPGAINTLHAGNVDSAADLLAGLVGAIPAYLIGSLVLGLVDQAFYQLAFQVITCLHCTKTNYDKKIYSFQSFEPSILR